MCAVLRAYTRCSKGCVAAHVHAGNTLHVCLTMSPYTNPHTFAIFLVHLISDFLWLASRVCCTSFIPSRFEGLLGCTRVWGQRTTCMADDEPISQPPHVCFLFSPPHIGLFMVGQPCVLYIVHTIDVRRVVVLHTCMGATHYMYG